MSGSDSAFTGKVADGYEHDLVPMLFAPYADDLAERIAAHSPSEILELAAGTGALTRVLSDRLPSAKIVATDLNDDMLERARHIVRSGNVRFDVMDACANDQPDTAFDVVACQFGVMFFPDKGSAYRHVKRVLRPGGTFIFSLWDIIQKNPVANALAKAYKAAVAQPSFIERVPYAYNDAHTITDALHGAGFTDVKLTKVEKLTTFHSTAAAIDAFVNGSPLGADFQALGMARSASVREAIFEALTTAFGEDTIPNPMTAMVVEAKAPA